MAALVENSRSVAPLSKRNKTYRQDSHVASLVEQAAKHLQIAEAEIVDACVLAQIEPVLERLQRRRLALQHPSALTALIQKLRHLRLR